MPNKLTPKQTAIVLKKVKTGMKSAETMIAHNLAALEGVLKYSDAVDIDLSKLKARMFRILDAMEGEMKK